MARAAHSLALLAVFAHTACVGVREQITRTNRVLGEPAVAGEVVTDRRPMARATLEGGALLLEVQETSTCRQSLQQRVEQTDVYRRWPEPLSWGVLCMEPFFSFWALGFSALSFSSLNQSGLNEQEVSDRVTAGVGLGALGGIGIAAFIYQLAYVLDSGQRVTETAIDTARIIPGCRQAPLAGRTLEIRLGQVRVEALTDDMGRAVWRPEGLDLRALVKGADGRLRLLGDGIDLTLEVEQGTVPDVEIPPARPGEPAEPEPWQPPARAAVGEDVL